MNYRIFTSIGRLRGLIGSALDPYTTWVWISAWAYLKGVSSLNLLHYLWRSLGPFSLPFFTLMIHKHLAMLYAVYYVCFKVCITKMDFRLLFLLKGIYSNIWNQVYFAPQYVVVFPLYVYLIPKPLVVEVQKTFHCLIGSYKELLLYIINIYVWFMRDGSSN